MFDFLKKKKPEGTELKLKITGMHCTNCAMTVDSALEDLDGVISADTSYARSEVAILFDPKKVNKKKMGEVLGELGYTVD